MLQKKSQNHYFFYEREYWYFMHNTSIIFLAESTRIWSEKLESNVGQYMRYHVCAVAVTTEVNNSKRGASCALDDHAI